MKLHCAAWGGVSAPGREGGTTKGRPRGLERDAAAGGRGGWRGSWRERGRARARIGAGRSACWGDVAWRAHHVAVPERVLAGALEDGLRDLYVGRCGEGGADVDEADASRLCRGPALNLFLKVALMEDHLVVRLSAEHAAEAAVALGEERAVVLAAADEGEDDILHVRRAGHHRLECADGAKGEQQRG